MNIVEPKAVKDLLSKETGSELLDVRSESEKETADIGGKLIPLGELADRIRELDKNKSYIVYCHHGGRSAQAVNFLQERGFKKLWNLVGGIDRWSLDVDESVPRY